MPRYVYECERCGEFEVEQRIDDATLQQHPGCGSRVQRVIAQTSFKLKGPGWASDGYTTLSTPEKGSSDT